MKLLLLVRNCQGQMAMPMSAQMYPPRRMLMYRGSRAVMSVPALMLLAARFVPSWARTKAAAMRKVPARSAGVPTPLGPEVMNSLRRSRGFQVAPREG